MARVPFPVGPSVALAAGGVQFSRGAQPLEFDPRSVGRNALMLSEAAGGLGKFIRQEEDRAQREQDRAEYRAERADAKAEREAYKLERLQDKADNAAVADADTVLIESLAKLHDPRQGLFAARGGMVSSAMEQYQKDYDKAVDEAARTLGNDTQRGLFMQRARERRVGHMQNAATFVARETERWSVASQETNAAANSNAFLAAPESSPLEFAGALAAVDEAVTRATGDKEQGAMAARAKADELLGMTLKNVLSSGEPDAFDRADTLLNFYGPEGNEKVVAAMREGVAKARAAKVDRDEQVRIGFGLADAKGAAGIEDITKDFQAGKITNEQMEQRKRAVRERVGEIEFREETADRAAMSSGVQNLTESIRARAELNAARKSPQRFGFAAMPAKVDTFEDAVGPEFMERVKRMDPERVQGLRNLWESGEVLQSTSWGAARLVDYRSDPSKLRGVPWEDVKNEVFGNLTADHLQLLEASWHDANGRPYQRNSGGSTGSRGGKGGPGGLAAEIDDALFKTFSAASGVSFGAVVNAAASMDPMWEGLPQTDPRETHIRRENLPAWFAQRDYLMKQARSLMVNDPAKYPATEFGVQSALSRVIAENKLQVRTGGGKTAQAAALAGDDLDTVVTPGGETVNFSTLGGETWRGAMGLLAASDDPADKRVAALYRDNKPGVASSLAPEDINRLAFAVKKQRAAERARDAVVVQQGPGEYILGGPEKLDAYITSALRQTAGDPARVASYMGIAGSLLDHLGKEYQNRPMPDVPVTHPNHPLAAVWATDNPVLRAAVQAADDLAGSVPRVGARAAEIGYIAERLRDYYAPKGSTRR